MKGNIIAFFVLYAKYYTCNVAASEPEYYCDCYKPTGELSFNYSCLNECYFNFTDENDATNCTYSEKYNCEFFLEQYMKLRSTYPVIGPKKIVDVFSTPSATVLALRSEISTRFSFEGQAEFSCNLTLATLHKETSFLKKCFHYSEECLAEIKFPDYLTYDLEKLEQYKACLFRIANGSEEMDEFSTRKLIQTKITDPTAVKTICKVSNYETLETIEFPIELKKRQEYGEISNSQRPSNDIELYAWKNQLSEKFHEITLSWTCPSEWNGYPDIFKIVCVRIPQKDHTSNCELCSETVLHFNFKNETQFWACRMCWSESGGQHIDYIEGGHLSTEPYETSNTDDFSLAYTISWRKHRSSFLVYDCGASCVNSTLPVQHGETHIWRNSNATNMQFICIIKAKNTERRQKNAHYLFGDESDHLVVSNLPTKKSKSFLSIHYWDNNAAHFLELDPKDNHDFLKQAEKKFHGLKPAIDGIFMFPSDVQAANPLIRNKSGCYDWISQRWYFPSKLQNLNISGTEFSHQEYSVDGTDYAVINSTHDPVNVACFPSKSLVMWTLMENDGTISLAEAKISAVAKNSSLHIMLSKHANIPSFKMCGGNCQLIKDFASPFIDVWSSYHNSSLFLIAENGIWKISMDMCHCDQVASSETLQKQFADLSSVRAFTVFDEDTLYFSTASIPLIQLKLPDSWTLIKTYFTFDSSYFDSEIPVEMLEELPGYPSHLLEPVKLVEDVSDFSAIKLQTISYEDPIVQVPLDCRLPLLQASKGVKLVVQMLSRSTANISILPSVNTRNNCPDFRKPPLVYNIRYGILLTNVALTCESGSCPCDTPEIASCRHVKTAPSRKTNIQLTIGYLIPDQDYVVEAFPIPHDPMTGKPDALPDNFNSAELQGKKHGFVGVFHSKYVAESHSNAPLITGVTVPLFLLISILICIVIFAYNKKWYMYRNLNRIGAKDIKKKHKLGEGHFGEVWEAELIQGNSMIPVAIKLLNESAGEKEKRQFLEEAIILSKLSHPNIVKSIGICMSSEPVTLALEFLSGGSLQHYLRQTNIRSQLEFSDLLQIISELCKACLYLEKSGYIHRDISAKNCLLSLHQDSSKPKVAKLADFGLAKDTAVEHVYSAGKDAVIPVPYTAPEGLTKGNFTIKGDIWSFGVLIWETFTWAATPYGRCYFAPTDPHSCPLKQYSLGEVEFMVAIDKKSLNDLSDPCTSIFTDSLINIMALCWEFRPEDRPTFQQLEKYIHGLSKHNESALHKGFPSDFLPTQSSPVSSPESRRGSQPMSMKAKLFFKKRQISAGPGGIKLKKATSVEHGANSGTYVKAKKHSVVSVTPAYGATVKTFVEPAEFRQISSGSTILTDAYANNVADADRFSVDQAGSRENTENITMRDAYATETEENETIDQTMALRDAYSGINVTDSDDQGDTNDLAAAQINHTLRDAYDIGINKEEDGNNGIQLLHL